ncbi:MAG: tripartite tricarboxylate transporter TctB family protein [Burkholderiales bacterium]|nr:tripartite tricarboxylate transporter TctB family protein [Burkholderiales bacterium]
MKIKNYQDFYAGIMFMIFGGLATWLSKSYSMGTGARMGPGYFPYHLGLLLAILGLIVLVKSLGKTQGEHKPGLMTPMYIFLAMMGFSLAAGWLGASPNASLAIGTIAGCVFAFFVGMRSLGLILGAVTVFGLMLKGLGLVVCVTMLVIIAALASHERRTIEVVGSIVVLSGLAVGIFVYGLKLQMPTWPDMEELQRSFTPAAKKK